MTNGQKHAIWGIGIGALAFGIWYFFINAEDYATARAEYIAKLPDDKSKLITKILKSSGMAYSTDNSLAVQAQYPTLDAMKNRLADLNIPKYLRNYL